MTVRQRREWRDRSLALVGMTLLGLLILYGLR